MSNYTSNVGVYGANQGKGALYLSKQLCSTSTSVISTLCYGIQWDAMLDFVKDTNHNVTNSTSWDNNYDNTYTTTATSQYSTDHGSTWYSGPYTKSTSGSVLLTTGANENFKAKNIYDIAGNVYEWTMEAYPIDNCRAYHGGGYNSTGSVCPAAHRTCTRAGASYYDNYIRIPPSTLHKVMISIGNGTLEAYIPENVG